MRWPGLNYQFVARIEVFVKPPTVTPASFITSGNADAFETAFAKPLGRNAYDASVCLRLISSRITHRSCPLLPAPAELAPIVAPPSGSGHHNCESIIIIYITHMQAAFFQVQHLITNSNNSKTKILRKQINAPKKVALHKILCGLWRMSIVL
jgi:hypothetical protein